MADESGESMEPMKEVPLKDWVSQNWRDQCAVEEEKPRVYARDEGKHTGKNDPLFVAAFEKTCATTQKTQKSHIFGF